MLEEVVQVNERFLLALGGFLRAIALLLRRSLHVPHVRHVSPLMGSFFDHLFSLLSSFKES
jgi:hypothetical protein